MSPFQQAFIIDCITKKTSLTVYLINGVKLQGKIEAHDDETIVLSRNLLTQLVYKHAISTLMPVTELPQPKGEIL